jgi:hypothetical protein
MMNVLFSDRAFKTALCIIIFRLSSLPGFSHFNIPVKPSYFQQQKDSDFVLQ